MSRIQALITFDESWDEETVLQIFEPGGSISQGITGCEIVKENTPCRNCGSTAGTYSMGKRCLSCHCEA
jgi:hypothetical protein